VEVLLRLDIERRFLVPRRRPVAEPLDQITERVPLGLDDIRAQLVSHVTPLSRRREEVGHWMNASVVRARRLGKDDQEQAYPAHERSAGNVAGAGTHQSGSAEGYCSPSSGQS